MAVAAPAGLSAGLLMVLVLRLLTKRRGRDLVVGAISSSVVNGANMGFPIAAYVLGDISHAIPVILFQQAIYTPLYLFVRSEEHTSELQSRGHLVCRLLLEQ